MNKKLTAIIMGALAFVGVIAMMIFSKDHHIKNQNHLVDKETAINHRSIAGFSTGNEEFTLVEESTQNQESETEDSNNQLEGAIAFNKESEKNDNQNLKDTSDTIDISEKEKKSEDTELIKIPDTDSNVNKKPETPKPEVQKPETPKPETPKPEVQKPEAPKPEAPKPEIQKPEAPKPEITNGTLLIEVEQLIFQKVNGERAKAGLAALANNSTMQKYARIKSTDMGDRNYFSHENPEGNLITTTMKQDGVSYNAWGENIAYIGGMTGSETLAQQFMTNWMNSQGHRENILSTNFDSMGVGVYQIGDKVYATQEFMK